MPPNKSKRSAEDSPERRSKRRRQNDEEEEEEKESPAPSKGKASSSKKTPQFSGGGGSSHKPAELFRKDLISAMKLPDSEPLAQEDYFLIADPWRQEWERGVQVPVNESALRAVELREVTEKPKGTGDFKIPKKFLHGQKDETYQLGQHELTGMAQLAEQVVRYDLDDLDVCWLQELNSQREEVGELPIYEWTMERVVETLEARCHENMEIKKKTEEGLGIEYDEDIVCEICQSPESEDTNEMVFCDGCDICVHQACYGIQTVPEGSWLCRTCALGIKPQCILCPKVGGAMKSTRSGTKWAHVSCAIWIPEVTIGCVEKMEPITKISMIPASRWALICCICKERCGACIQCSVKACKTAFHVTCAISEKLEMKTVLIEDKNTEDVKLKAYCPKHSKKRERAGSESEPDTPKKSVNGTPMKESQMSEEERATLRAERLQKLEEEFYDLVKPSDVASELDLPVNDVDLIYVYWKLKRRSLFNRPLLTPKTEEADLLEKQQEDSLLARMKMFVHLRQDLERVRNLSYMISRREKIKKQFNSARESVFYAALEVLTDKTLNLPKREVDKIVKSYRDLPEPYGNQKTKSPSEIKAEQASSRRSSEKSDSGSEQKKVKSTSEEVTAKKIPGNRKSISETPVSRKVRLTSVKQEKEETDVDIQLSSDLNSSALDTSEIIDVGTESDTPVNTSQESSGIDNTTIVQSESDAAVKVETIKQPRKRGRPSLSKNKKIIAPEKPDKTDGTSHKDSEVSSKRRTRSSLPDLQVESEDKSVKVEEEMDSVKPQECLEPKLEDTKVKTEKRDRRASSVKMTEAEKEEFVKRFPSARNVSDHVKAELHGYFKNNKLVVSKDIRQKVQNALLNSKRRSRYGKGIVIDHSQKKIDTFFMKSPPLCDPDSPKSPGKAVSRVLNELSPSRDRYEANSLDRSARFNRDVKVSDFTISHRSGNTPRNSPSSRREKSEERNGERTPDRRVREKLFDGDGGKLLDGDKKRITRSSRESSPESTVSSVKSYSSVKRHRQENPRMRTRSNTPLSVGRDSDESESENICRDSKRPRR